MVAGLASMSLFHQPSFSDKIHHDIDDQDHLIALFAAMFSLSSRYHDEQNSTTGFGCSIPSHSDFHAISLRYINIALDTCSHDGPPLCVLQAMTLAGYYKLINGVYGPAWRLVGAGIRVAYELRLHLTDHESKFQKPLSERDVSVWILLEERRRCWWALWEMDCFCSTIQRTPSAIDRTMNKTYLPISDENWFANKFQASCFLQNTPEERLKSLKGSGNENCVAWTILLFSLMHDAQVLCHGNIPGILSGIDVESNIANLVEYFGNPSNYAFYKSAFEGLSELVKTYQDIKDNLPEALTHRGEFLSFGLTEGENTMSSRRASASKYSVGMAKASAIYTIYQNHVFMDILEGVAPQSTSTIPSGTNEQSLPSKKTWESRLGLQNFLQASETVLELVDSCPDDHVKYVNPYFASTVWIAAALQAFKRRSQWDPNPILTEKRRMALRQIYLRFVNFWGTPMALLHNMDSLETRLDARQRDLEKSGSTEESWDSCRTHGSHQSVTEQDPRNTSDWSPQSIRNEPVSAPVVYPFDQPLVRPSDATTQASLSVPEVEWLSTVVPDPNLSENLSVVPTDWTSALADDLFVDDFACYSSDLTARLYYGYTR